MEKTMKDNELKDAKKPGEGVHFERIRRITGYLVGGMDSWNDAKKAEERDRVRHGVTKETEDSRNRS